MKTEDIEIALIKSVLDYDPITGRFHWLQRVSQRSKAGDEAGYDTVFGYRGFRIKGKQYRAHRLAWLLAHGELPSSEIDHINGDRKDNRLCNLRLATRQQQQFNRKTPKNNTSGAKGVCWDRIAKKWRALITRNGRNHFLGHFVQIEDAKAAYENAAARLFGEFKRTEP